MLAVGRLVAKKGFDVLVEAAARVERPFRLRIVGEGPEREALERRISSAGLGGRIELCGPRTHAELPGEYASADLVVVPSVVDPTGDRDGLPNVVLEAMACARPVVASDVAAIATAVTPGETGLLVPASRPGRPRRRDRVDALPTRRCDDGSGTGRGGGSSATSASARAPSGSGGWWTGRMAEPRRTPEAGAGTVAYLLKGFPRMSEIFIASEIHRLERAGVRIRLYVIKQPDEPDRHPVVDRIRARPSYLPPASPVSDTTARAWLRANLRPFLPSLAATLRRRPAGVLRAGAGGASRRRCARGNRAGPPRAGSISRSSSRPWRCRRGCSRPATCATCTRTSPTAARPSRGSPR